MFIKAMASIVIGATLALVPSANGASVAASVPGAWCAAYNAGTGVMDVMGDSIMEGLPESAPRWHSSIWDWFKTQNKPGIQLWTGGAVGGSQVADFLPGGSLYGHTQFAIAYSPQLIVIGLGTNAHLSGQSPAAFEAQYRQLLGLLPSGSTKLLVHGNWVSWNGFPRAYDQRAYLEVLERISADTGNPLLRLSDKMDVGTYHYASDGVHASQAGEYVKFNAFRGKLTLMCP